MRWDDSFRKACEICVDPVVPDGFAKKEELVAYENWVSYAGEEIQIGICFEIPLLPRISIQCKNLKGI